ncbi:hypothetical protein WICPIJ_010131 [Wickerhamomyces pijperi]|uniref:Uncharacterized protein n=1 Tax=Wickerhamomyces pijperi TaxID=599730 RepID=A0A9P8PHF3_WICPI|nr:hypothetical protein WICPIJ_010131 [Wickerhamomyces pijperi]
MDANDGLAGSSVLVGAGAEEANGLEAAAGTPNGLAEEPPNGFDESVEAPNGFESCLFPSKRKFLALSSFNLSCNCALISSSCSFWASSIFFGSLQTALMALTEPFFLLHWSFLQPNT